MHHFFSTKKIYRCLIVIGLCLAMLLAPLPCHAAKKKKAKAARPANPRTVKVAKIQPSQPAKLPKVQPSCPPGMPFEDEVQRFIGIPYRRGGTDDRGLDCSGLAQRFFSLVHGIDLPHNSAAQSQLDFLEKVPPREDELEASDLLFFGPGKKRINHVGIYLADGKFLHASPKEGVVISNLDEAYWQKRLITSRRLKESAAKSQSAADGGAENSFSYSDWRVRDTVNAEQTLAMGVRHTLVDSLIDVNIGAFHTSNVSSADPEVAYRQTLAEGYNDVDHRQGVRAFVDFTPSQWLRITPSLSMVEWSGLAYDQDERQHVYGLETAISLPQSPWHLAMSAHSSRTTSAYYPWRLPTDETQIQRRVDLAFSVGYRMGNDMTFSIYGARDAATTAADGESGKNLAGGMSDLAVQLQWIF